MSQEIRRELISKNLGIIPINHGKVYTFQIALPDPGKQEISLERSQAIESSLLQHQSNLASLILRRTESYGDDIEYELVYGAEWLQVAQKLDIEMLWAWVFDMTDEQALAAKAELSQLFSSSISVPDSGEQHPVDSADLEQMIDRKLQSTANSIKQVLAASLDKFKEAFDDKLKTLHYGLDRLTDSFSEIPELSTQINQLREQIESVGLKSTGSRAKALTSFNGIKTNLLTASEQEITNLLSQVVTQPKQIEAALKAIAYWNQPGKTLTWENLERSTKSGTAHKIPGFAQGTLDRLKQIGEI
ncbi:MAG: hypothetical protein KME15_22010 [Drouetiella hepatica Uher 2000/2452]|jgi:hypothetical protein|uniref:Uncharacterized protein n=1 Tax=Drouetiella hepatica Uher 2000/2452 TaxID=904376 RepID=A0A951URA4_9CYAN|nr:hypothetical protein [Drouetiella hepatica Uher 2000/2452]